MVVESECLRETLIAQFRSRTASAIDELFDGNETDNHLRVIRISKASPLEIVLIGSVAAIVLAVILSGGEVDIKLAKAKLNPLGDGIRKLKDAIASGRQVQPGYAVKGIRVKLNKIERAELRKQPTESAGQGGFQRLLVGLKLRTERSGELELTPDDVKTIEKYGADPKKGGWQARLKRIFGRHLNFPC
jgi:hypothetical protein